MIQKTPNVPRNVVQHIIPRKNELSLFPQRSVFAENDVESRYIQHFLQRTTTGFEGMMDWTLWNRVLMQLSHQQPFVRDMVVAIGALTKSLETADPSGKLLIRLPNDTVGMAKMHKEFAYLKYGKAVKDMQTVLLEAEPRQVLIACLLVICFEMLLNNRHPALSHIVSGHRLLRGWLRPPMLGSIDSPLISLEDDIVEAFENLDLQICTIYDGRPLLIHRTILEEALEAIQQMPSSFNNLIEARKYLTLMMKRSYHFLATIWVATDAAGLSRDFSMTPPGDIFVSTGFNIFSTTHILPVTLATEQKVYADEHSRWSQAFMPLFQSTRCPPSRGSRKFLAATLMKIHAIATGILLAGVLFVEECAYDAFLPQFREMLTLIHIIVDAYQKRGDSTGPGDTAFLLDLGIISPLFLLLIRCRDRQIRRHAIAILKGWHAELGWHPRLIAELGSFLLEIEEEGHPDGPIPETSRAVITRICEAAPNQNYIETLVQCVQRRGGPGGGPIWKEKMIVYATHRSGIIGKTFT